MSDVLSKHLFTVEDYMRMADAGVFNGSRVELVHGEIYSMPPQGNLHSIAVPRLYDELRAIFPRPYFIRIQATHRFGRRLALEPDLAVLEAEPVPSAVLDATPLLVVEVSDSTIDYDFETKRLIYAQQSVPEYWVLDVNENQLHVFREPNPLASDFLHAYAQHATLDQQDSIAPLAASSKAIALKNFLPLIVRE